MNVSPNELRKETVKTLKAVELELDVVQFGQHDVIAPLLLAKAQCLNTLVLLNDPKRK